MEATTTTTTPTSSVPGRNMDIPSTSTHTMMDGNNDDDGITASSSTATATVTTVVAKEVEKDEDSEIEKKKQENDGGYFGIEDEDDDDPTKNEKCKQASLSYDGADTNIPSQQMEKHVHDDDDVEEGEEQVQLCEYELKRLRNVERNYRRLVALGLGDNTTTTAAAGGGTTRRRRSGSKRLLEQQERQQQKKKKRKQSNSGANMVTPQKGEASNLQQQKRRSSRLVETRKKKKGDTFDTDASDDDDDGMPEYDTNNKIASAAAAVVAKQTNGYYEVDDILGRRERKIRNDPGRKVVEYEIRWKVPLEHEESTCWLIAENLDQNSLAIAFSKFPTELDPYDRHRQQQQKREQHEHEQRRRRSRCGGGTNKDEDNQDQQRAQIDDDDDVVFDRMALEEDGWFLGATSDEEEGEEEEVDDNDDGNEEDRDGFFSDDDDDDDNAGCNDAELQLGDDDMMMDEDELLLKDPSMKNEISSLRDSDYDQPGTVEVIINRRVYRVGQSFICEDGIHTKKVIYTITTLIPRQRQAVCLQLVPFDHTFVCPKGCEGTYVQLSGDITVDLASLKVPYKRSVRKLSLRYEQDNITNKQDQRSFSYYYEDNTKIQNHFPQSKPTALDLFAGVGGMGLGLKNAGFHVKYAVENNPLTAATLQANLLNSNSGSTNGTQVFVEDVKTFLKRCREEHPCYPSIGDVNHIHASTPCKGFSRANRNGGKDDLRNNQQTALFIKAIKHFKPMTATFENVPGLVLKDYKRYLQSMVTSLLRISYQVRVGVLTASSYGDPQNRRRVILWAARRDCILPSLPVRTHGSSDGLYPLNTSKDALYTLEDHTPTPSKSSGVIMIKAKNIYNHICPTFKRSVEDDKNNKKKSTTPKKKNQYNDNFVLKENEPSRTILARARPHIHYKFDRFITVREAACLQSFPADFQFFGSLSKQYGQVGNAVPIKLATAVSRSVAKVHGLP